MGPLMYRLGPAFVGGAIGFIAIEVACLITFRVTGAQVWLTTAIVLSFAVSACIAGILASGRYRRHPPSS